MIHRGAGRSRPIASPLSSLCPPNLLQAAIAAFRESDLQHVLVLARNFAVGEEGAARAYVQYRLEQMAIFVRLKRCYYSHALSATI